MAARGSDVVFLLLLSSVAGCEAFDVENEIEARGKEKKIALYVYFADLVIKKIFILKLVYAVVFWIVIHKAGYFLAWFVSYLKEHKKHHEHYVPHYYGHYGANRKGGEPYRKEGASNRIGGGHYRNNWSNASRNRIRRVPYQKNGEKK